LQGICPDGRFPRDRLEIGRNLGLYATAQNQEHSILEEVMIQKLFIYRNFIMLGITMYVKLNATNWPSNLFGAAVLMIALLALCLASAQAGDNTGQSMISEDEASQIIIDTLVKNLTESSELEMGLRVNQYQDLLEAGAQVIEANPDEIEPSSVLVCQNASWLFFLDLAPGAHFAHPVIIAVLDAVSGEIQSMDAQWWPVIVQPAFEKETQRRDPETIIFEKESNL